MKKSIILTVIILCLLAITAVTETHAYVTYAYAGNELKCQIDPYSTISGITGWFTIAKDPIGAQYVVPTDFMFTTVNGQTFRPQLNDDGWARFYIVSTGGPLEQWSIDINDATLYQTLNSSRIRQGDGDVSGDWFSNGAAGMDSITWSNYGSPGVWTRTSSSPVPLPPSFLLVAPGLIGLWGWRRMKQRSA
jgi:hypothetical protein